VHVFADWVTVNRRPAIITLPVRWVALVLGAIVKLTEPAPEPVAPLVTVIQAALLAAVQLQPVVVVTAAEPVPPAAVTVWVVGETENAQADAFCVTVNVSAPIVIVAVRDCVAVLAVALNVTSPLPVPLPPPDTVNQLALLTAVHAHPAPAVTLVNPDPRPEPMVVLAGEIETVHDTPAWLTVKLWPPIVSAAARAWVDVFAAAVKLTVAVPLPLAVPLTVNQPGAVLAAVQAQPLSVVSVVDPPPPLAAICWLVGDRL